MVLAPLSGRFHAVSAPSEGVALLQLNRPPLNAFHEPMWTELKSTVKRLNQHPDVRVIVLASALEKGFTAGLDLKSTTLAIGTTGDPARQALELQKHILEFQSAISSLADSRVPVIAAISGVCLGLGIDITSACDIRVASSDSVFSIAEVNVGLAADIGTLQRLPKIVGNNSKARELAMTGRKFDAREAKDIGFLSSVVEGGRKEVTDAALKIARTIAEKSPVAVIGTKHLMDHARDHTVREGLDYTALWNSVMLQTQDLPTAMKSALAKQTPQFSPLATKAKL